MEQLETVANIAKTCSCCNAIATIKNFCLCISPARNWVKNLPVRRLVQANYRTQQTDISSIQELEKIGA